MKANHLWPLIIVATILTGGIWIQVSRQQRLREHDSQPAESPTPKIQTPHPHIGLKLSVLRSGKVLANGKEIPFDQLDLKLSMAKCFEARVRCYVEDDGEGEPPPIAAEVIRRVIGMYRLTLSMSRKPDFSDLIDGPT